MLYKIYLRRTKSKLNNITFVYSTIQLFILTLLFRQQKVGGNFRTGKERTPKKTSGTFTLHCAQLCSETASLTSLLCSNSVVYKIEPSFKKNNIFIKNNIIYIFPTLDKFIWTFKLSLDILGIFYIDTLLFDLSHLTFNAAQYL